MNENQDQVPNQPPPLPVQTPGQAMDKQERNWAMFCHLAALSGYLVPFGFIIGPLVVWLIKKEEYPLVDDQGKEAINFQITMTICFIVSVILVFVLIGILLLPALAIFNIIMIIVATIKANNGERYRYPFAIRIIKQIDSE